QEYERRGGAGEARRRRWQRRKRRRKWELRQGESRDCHRYGGGGGPGRDRRGLSGRRRRRGRRRNTGHDDSGRGLGDHGRLLGPRVAGRQGHDESDSLPGCHGVVGRSAPLPPTEDG
ncbi:unnamed protein product, partial [Ectocarpus fasciculatus]